MPPSRGRRDVRRRPTARWKCAPSGRCGRKPAGADMQYLLMIYADEAIWPDIGAEVKERQMSAAYATYIEELNKAGVVIGMNRLQPVATAATVRMADGKPQVL